MRHFKIIGSLIWTTAVSIGTLAAQTGHFDLYGKIDKDVTGIVTLIDYTPDTGQLRDTLPIKNGKFHFQGTTKEGRHLWQVMLHVGKRDYSHMLYSEAGNTYIHITEGLENFSITGHALNKVYNGYVKMIGEMVDSARKATNSSQITEFSEELQDTKFDIIAHILRQHPESIVGLDQLSSFTFGYRYPEKIKPLYTAMSDELKNSEVGLELKNRIKGMTTVLLGNQAPAFVTKDTLDHRVTLADFKGKYVLLDFWATWCLPCLEEMPYVSKAYEKYKDKGFTVLGYSLDNNSSKAKWLKFIQTKKMVWPQASDLNGWESTPVLLYNLVSVPANFLIDPDGKIIATNLRGEALEKKLSEILPESN